MYTDVGGRCSNRPTRIWSHGVAAEQVRFRKTCKTERAAQIELGKLLAMAQAGRQPDSDVTVAQLLDQYVSTAGWDVSTRESNLGYIRRTINPALGSMQVRKVRGPLLDTLYARLMRCGNLTCTGKPFTEHRNIPDLRPDPTDRRLEWEQAADRVRAAIRSGQLTSGDTLPSVPDLARLQGLKPGTIRHAFLALAEEGLVHIRHGRTTTIAANRPLTSPVHASRSLARVLATTASCPAAARTSASPWRKAPSVASTTSCPGPFRQRCGGSGLTGTRPRRRGLPPPAVKPSLLRRRKMWPR